MEVRRQLPGFCRISCPWLGLGPAAAAAKCRDSGSSPTLKQVRRGGARTRRAASHLERTLLAVWRTPKARAQIAARALQKQLACGR
eukprot:10665453-Alexandrium_andersonii.AAC.1